MSLDRNKVTAVVNKQKASDETAYVAAAAIVDPLVLRLDELASDPKDAKVRAELAAAALTGGTPAVIESVVQVNPTGVFDALMTGMDSDQRELAKEVITGNLGADQVKTWRQHDEQQANQPAALGGTQPQQTVQGEVVNVRHDDELVTLNRDILVANLELISAYTEFNTLLGTAETDADAINRLVPTTKTRAKVSKLLDDVRGLKEAHDRVTNAMDTLNGLNKLLEIRLGILDQAAKPAGT